MKYAIKNGKIIAGEKILEGYTLYFEGEKILAITKDTLATDEAFLAATAFQATHGATTVLPTITSSNYADLKRAIEAYERVKDSKTHGAYMPGKPYCSPKREFVDVVIAKTRSRTRTFSSIVPAEPMRIILSISKKL